MSRIGILGGSGPEASADLLLKLLRTNRETLGDAYVTDRDAPDIVLISAKGIGGPRLAPGPDGLSIDLSPGTPEYATLWGNMSRHFLELAAMTDRVCLCCNQLHMFQPKVEALLEENGHGGKLVSIIDTVTNTVLAAEGDKSVAIFGAMGTTDPLISPYRPLCEALGDRCVRLEMPVRQQLHALVADIKTYGTEDDRVVSAYQLLVDQMSGAYLPLWPPYWGPACPIAIRTSPLCLHKRLISLSLSSHITSQLHTNTTPSSRTPTGVYGCMHPHAHTHTHAHTKDHTYSFPD